MVGVNSKESKGITFTTTTIAPETYTSPDTKTTTSSMPAPESWTFDIFIKVPDFSTTNDTYKTLLHSGDWRLAHITVRTSDAMLGSFFEDNSLTTDPYGKKCDIGFQNSGISLTDSILFPKNVWSRITVSASKGIQTYYINGEIQGKKKRYFFYFFHFFVLS